MIRLLGAVVSCLALAAGCTSALVGQTARAVPEGETALAYGGGLGHVRGELLRYEEPTHPAWPDWRNEGGVESWPLVVTPEWFARVEHGLPLGLQVEAQIAAPLPVGLAGGVGLKWQLLGGEEEPFALAVAGRVAGSAGGFDSVGAGGSFRVWSWDAGLVASVHGRAGALYLSPRYLEHHLLHRSWYDGHEASVAVGGGALGGAVGGVLGDEVAGRGYFLEVFVAAAPAQAASPSGGVLVLVGGGARGLVGLGD